MAMTAREEYDRYMEERITKVVDRELKRYMEDPSHDFVRSVYVVMRAEVDFSDHPPQDMDDLERHIRTVEVQHNYILQRTAEILKERYRKLVQAS